MSQDEKDVQANEELRRITEAAAAQDIVGVAASIAVSLLRLAVSVERMQEMAEADMEDAMNEAIESKSKDLAEEMVAAKSKRGFIGAKK